MQFMLSAVPILLSVDVSESATGAEKEGESEKHLLSQHWPGQQEVH